MSILKFKDIAIILNIDPKYKAHTSPDGQNKETLKAHIDLVFVYFLKLMEQNRLEPLLDKLFIKSAALLEGSIAKEPFGDFVKYIFAKAICPIPRYNTQTNTPSNQAYTKGVSSEILAYYNDLLTRGRLTDDITSSHSANNL